MAIFDYRARERFAEVVYSVRNGQSYRSYGKKLGVTGTTVKSWETCEFEPSLENLEKIAAEAGLTLNQLMDYLEIHTQASSDVDQKKKLIAQLRQLPRHELAEVVEAGVRILATAS